MYLNELEGAIPHCVMCSTPSIHGVFIWCMPCQWIEVASELNLLYTSTTTMELLRTMRVGPGNRLLIVRIDRNVLPSTVIASVQRGSSLTHEVELLSFGSSGGSSFSCPRSLKYHTLPP